MRRRKRMIGDLDQDIRNHIEIETRENIERGMSPDEAHFAALRKFGNVTRVKEETWEVWSFPFLEQFVADVGFGVRALRKNPAFTAVAVLTLALGIGANTAIFSFVDAVLLKPLPYPHPERIVSVWEKNAAGFRTNFISTLNFLDWKRQSRCFQFLSAVASDTMTLTGSGTPQ